MSYSSFCEVTPKQFSFKSLWITLDTKTFTGYSVVKLLTSGVLVAIYILR